MRALAGLFVAAAALTFAPASSAAVYAHAERTAVRAGGVLRIQAVGSGMPLYLVPAADTPTERSCGTHAVCAARVPRAPTQAPYVLLGHVPRSSNTYAEQTFRLRVPSTVRSGAYRLVMYCAQCYSGPGGSLIPDTTLVRVRH